MTEKGSEQLMSVFDQDTGVVVFNISKAYSDECMDNKRVLNKVKSDIYSSKSNTTPLMHLTTEGREFAQTGVDKISICGKEVYETNVKYIAVEVNTNAEEMKSDCHWMKM